MRERTEPIGHALKMQRFACNPLIVPHMDDRMDDNINGPSLIRVPQWVPKPLGRYYLYFAHHQGIYIRLAYADQLEGPWRVHRPGALDLSASFFDQHIASPDVHVLDDLREIRMYYHGCRMPEPPHQTTRLAVSANGIDFVARPDVLGASYWRAFQYRGRWYTLEMPGTFRRSTDGVSGFEQGPTLFTPDMRHAAVKLDGDTLTVFYSNANDCPERILWSTVRLGADWNDWRATPPETLLAPETEWEGADCALEPSRRGSVHVRARQLRDPCYFAEDGREFLLYSVAGEHGIAIGELT
jgi:hypothetical protein